MKTDTVNITPLKWTQLGETIRIADNRTLCYVNPFGDEDEGIPSEEDVNKAKLIVAAVNACKEINTDNPIAVANELPDLIHFLEGFVYDVTEGMKVVKDGNSIKKIKAFLADIHKQK
jgi:hypothetical protein